METSELLTTASAAVAMKIVPDTLRAWRRNGRIKPAFTTPTGVSLYRREDCERIAEERRVAAARKHAQHGTAAV